MPLDIEGFRKAGYAAIDRICDYFESIQKDELPVVALTKPGYIKHLVDADPPQDGEPFENIFNDFDRVILPGITHWQSPSFFAYYPANQTLECIIAEMLSAAVSNPGFNWACSPACTELEAIVMDWVAKMLGLDKSFWLTSEVGGGVIMGSASEAFLTIAVAARERALKIYRSQQQEQQQNVPGAETTPPTPKLVIYATTETHSLGIKAAMILGVEFRALKVFEEDGWALRGATLKRRLEEDRERGWLPFVLVATVGTTSSGATDRLDEICEVAKDHPSLFIHVDAALAGVTLSCPEYRSKAHLSSINAYCHSFVANLHKAGLTGFDATCLYVRDRKWLRDSLDITPPFLRTNEGDQGTVIDYRNWILGLGRRFRSLKIYFMLKSFGIEGFREHVRRLVSLAECFENLIKRDGERVFELFCERNWLLVVFRIRTNAVEVANTQGRDGAKKEENGEQQTESMEKNKRETINRNFYQKISVRKDIMLTQTEIGGNFCIRFAVGSPYTREEHIEKAFGMLKEVAKETVEEFENLEKLKLKERMN